MSSLRVSAVLLVAASSVVSACGSGNVDTVVIDALVTISCVEGGDCAVEPDRISVGHCGTDAFYDDDDGVARAISDLPAEDIAVIVAVRHEQGAAPAEADNGGTTRGFVVAEGDSAEVGGLLRPERALYVVDDLAQIVEVDQSALRSQDGDVFTFAYRVGDFAVEEAHTLRLREQRPFDLTAPNAFTAGCCASIDASTTTLWLVAGLLPLLVRRRRRA